jgi:PmbA protein
MPSHDLLARCREAVARARRLGADGAEVYGETIESINSTVEKNDLQISKSQFETVFGVRAFIEGRVGFASTNDLARLPAACEDAVALARISPKDPHNVLPAPQDVTPVDGLYDPSAESFGAADAVERSAKMLSLAESIDPRLTLTDAWFDAGVRDAAVANSEGIAAAERGSLFAYGAIATAREGDRVSSFDFQFDATRAVDGIDVAPPVRRACENALGSLGAVKGESFRGSVLLAPSAVSQLLIGVLLFQLNARNGLRGRTRWKAADDGSLPGGVATAGFDREGVPHERLCLIAEGVLESFLHNAYTAAATGDRNTAHAAGSARSIPAIGPTNLSILSGNASFDELLSEIRQGLLVRRFSGNADPISGDFSGAAKAAHLVRDGKLAHAVSGTMIAGNVFTVLKAVSGLSRETERIYNLTLPYVRLEGVSVTA